MDPEQNRLLDLVFGQSPLAGQRFLNKGMNYVYPKYKEELLNPPPANKVECDKLVATWVARLENLVWALPHFPTIKTGRKRWAKGGIISAEGSPLPGPSATGSTAESSPPLLSRRNKDLSEECKERDQHACVITGCKSSDGFSIEAAHILPYALAKEAACRKLRFWSMLEIFFGVEHTDHIFDVTATNLDTLWNVVSLHNSIHSMYDNGRLVLVPMTLEGKPIPIHSTFDGAYKLQIRFPISLSVPEYIQSNKIIGKQGLNPLYDQSHVPIILNPNGTAIPCPSFFAFRAFFTWLKYELLETADWQTNLGHKLWE